MLNDDICAAWQGQALDPARVTLEEMRTMSGKFRSQIAWRNFREYGAAALLVICFGRCAWISPLPLIRAGNILMVAGLLYMAYQLHRRAAVSSMPAEMAWKSCAAFQRSELERQRDALDSVWKWYLGPLIPGLATILTASSIAAFQRSALIGALTILLAAAVGLALWWIGRLNQKAAALIQKQIDELEPIVMGG